MPINSNTYIQLNSVISRMQHLQRLSFVLLHIQPLRLISWQNDHSIVPILLLQHHDDLSVCKFKWFHSYFYKEEYPFNEDCYLPHHWQLPRRKDILTKQSNEVWSSHGYNCPGLSRHKYPCNLHIQCQQPHRHDWRQAVAWEDLPALSEIG